jgi:hypothetical protein
MRAARETCMAFHFLILYWCGASQRQANRFRLYQEVGTRGTIRNACVSVCACQALSYVVWSLVARRKMSKKSFPADQKRDESLVFCALSWIGNFLAKNAPSECCCCCMDNCPVLSFAVKFLLHNEWRSDKEILHRLIGGLKCILAQKIK